MSSDDKGLKNQNTEADRLRPFIADGIQEYDNALPRWWVWLFNGTIVFSVAYVLWLHVFQGETLQQEYQRELAESKSAQAAAPAATAGGAADESTLIAAGKTSYMTNCVPCHGSQGEGGVGPNLTDNFWIHGGSKEAITKSIAAGIAEKGMPPWQPVLGDKKVAELASYVMTLKGTNPPNGKAPQGTEEK